MKELSIEEKAKRYDEALKVLHKYDGANIMFSQSLKEEMFPELKESEDERIRKYLKHIIGEWSYDDLFAKGFRKEDIIAWLEKQGKNNMGISENTKQELEDSLHKALEKETPESCNEFLDEQILANSAKTCKDEQNPAWSKEDEKCLENAIMYCEWARDKAPNFHCYDTSEKSINFLKSLKDRVQPKQEWSEEDENTVASIISSLSNPQLYPPTIHDIEWLKSLKERYTWKPSDVQMGAIKDAIDYLGGNTKIVRKHLMSLYDQLKKLKE